MRYRLNRSVACVLFSFIPAITVASCQGQPQSEGGTPTPPDNGSVSLRSPRVSRTIVRLHPDGTSEATTDMIDRETQVAELAAHAEWIRRLKDADAGNTGPDAGRRFSVEGNVPTFEEGGVDSSCAYTSLVLYTGASYTGYEICFYAPGTTWASGPPAFVNLANYTYREEFFHPPPYPPTYVNEPWAGAVHSFVAGLSEGCMSTASTYNGTSSSNYYNFTFFYDYPSYSGNSDYAFLEAQCCATNQILCYNASYGDWHNCTSYLTDDNNCGGCGYTCPTSGEDGAGCVLGTCECASGYSMCGSLPTSLYCANLQGDVNNCGHCGTVCGTGTYYSGNSPPTPGCADGTCCVGATAECGTGFPECCPGTGCSNGDGGEPPPGGILKACCPTDYYWDIPEQKCLP